LKHFCGSYWGLFKQTRPSDKRHGIPSLTARLVDEVD
jgi:hypothetical protein